MEVISPTTPSPLLTPPYRTRPDQQVVDGNWGTHVARDNSQVCHQGEGGQYIPISHGVRHLSSKCSWAVTGEEQCQLSAVAHGCRVGASVCNFVLQALERNHGSLFTKVQQTRAFLQQAWCAKSSFTCISTSMPRGGVPCSMMPNLRGVSAVRRPLPLMPRNTPDAPTLLFS